LSDKFAENNGSIAPETESRNMPGTRRAKRAARDDEQRQATP
jgi:hypothetical protein